MNEHFIWLDWVVLIAYFVGTLGIGFYFHRRSKSAEGFTAANRSLPGWVCGLSIFATFLSSISFLGIPGRAFATNWNVFVFSLSLPIATLCAVYWFMPYYRRNGEVSAYAALEKRFGPWARVYAGAFYLLSQIARMGTVMYLMALPLNVLLGLDIRLIIVITGVTVTLYAMVGGIVAVIWTDAVQAIVLILGALISLAVLLLGMPEGPGQVFTIAAASDKFSLGSFDLSDWAGPTFFVVLVNGIVINLQNFGIDQNYVQRYIASSSEREAGRSVWLGGLLYVPVSAVFLLIGTSLFAWYQTHPDDMNELRNDVAIRKVADEGITKASPDYAVKVQAAQSKLKDEDLGDRVFPHFIGKRLPPGVTGLLIAAIFAAGMSTVSTSLNSSATLLMTDYYRRYLRPGATEAQAMRTLYLSTLLWGVIGTGVALLMINIKSALDVWWKLSSVLSGGMVGLFLLGLFSRRSGNVAAIAGVVAGVLVIAWMTLSQTDLWPASLEAMRCTLHPYLVIVIGTLSIIGIGLLVSMISPRKAGEGRK
ncbi:MAG: sodium:solute symporter [Phycisphaeraceae bacterium]